MPVVISQSDLKTNIVILIDYARHQSGPLAVAAGKLAGLWATQLTEQGRRDLSLAGINPNDLEGFGG